MNDENATFSIEEKAAILDWLLTSVPSPRADRPERLERTINRNKLQALMVFRAWGTVEETLTAIRKEMAK